MSWRRGKIPSAGGWSAFDLKQKQKQGCLESIAASEPYPSLASSPASHGQAKTSSAKKRMMKNGSDDAGPGSSEKPFVSVLVGAVDFPKLMLNNKDATTETRSQQDVNFFNQNSGGLGVLLPAEKLQEIYPWADRSLIEDVLAGVSNNIEEASSMLKAMESFEENDAVPKQLKPCSTQADILLGNEGINLQEISDFSDLKSIIEEYNKSKELSDDQVVFGNKVLSGAGNGMSLNNVRFYPLEPEWEEDDDVYLLHRKDAIRKMRSASHHSTAANDAYMRGDHAAAQHHSRKAREEWIAAQALNAEAAKRILDIRNSKNGMWTLDLHGLHAAEAIQALEEHLRKIETFMSSNHLASANRSSTVSGNRVSASLDSSDFCGKLNGSELTSSSLKSMNLQVITGKGNHSRGEPAIPAAIRSFLTENGYHYDETRPGVITVRPKFRRG